MVNEKKILIDTDEKKDKKQKKKYLTSERFKCSIDGLENKEYERLQKFLKSIGEDYNEIIYIGGWVYLFYWK